MSYNCVVMVKQVPDTKRITVDAMNEDGTVNRAALPAIFNPEDLNALEFALAIKEQYGGKVTVITMGLPAAAEILRDSLYRGADEAILVTDRKCAASDTLATSYILSCAVKKLNCDIVLCGRQAIDGDTAQVGPQAAEKIGIPQITYCEEVVSISKKGIQIKRRLERGVETVESAFPVLVTVHGSAPDCRSRNARLLMKYKHAETVTEMQDSTDDYLDLHDKRPYLKIKEWTVDDLNADETWLGLSGSPTKVKKVTNVVFTAKESKILGDKDEEIEDLIKELLENHTIG